MSYLLGTATVGAVFAVTLAVVGTLRRRRLREEIRPAEPRLEEGDIDRILTHGILVKDDEPPLDLEEIAAEERRFWESESWDGSEEF